MKVYKGFTASPGLVLGQVSQLDRPPLEWLNALGAQRCAVLCLGNIKGVARETIEALQARQPADFGA